jgi:hypothetical protein
MPGLTMGSEKTVAALPSARSGKIRTLPSGGEISADSTEGHPAFLSASTNISVRLE